MWMLDNRTPYAAERTWVRDKHGAHHWVIAVKATFDIAPDGSLKLADQQQPPLHAAEYFGEPGVSSVKYEADLLPMKPATDFVVLANAYAPRGRPATSVPVSVRLETIQKILVVHGERVYYDGLSGVVPYRALPFVSKPIRYELAYGGMDTSDPDPQRHGYDSRNPVGLGYAVDVRRLVGTRAHAIEYTNGDAARMGPAGFGPIASYWSPRLEYGGTYDARWQRTKSPLLPDDYDDRHTLCSPSDQRPKGYLYGGELVELVHMTEDGVLRFQLPKVYLTYTTWLGRRREEHRGRMVSVIVEPHERRLMVVWQTSLPVRAREVDYLDKTIIREKPYLT